jgi:signal transduction histidine kinase
MAEPIENKVETLLRKKLYFNYLPGYAKFLLEERLLPLVKYNLQTSKELDFHLMKYFDFMDEEKLIELSKVSGAAFLTAIIENNLDEYLRISNEKWKANQLPLISREQIVAEDLALTSLIRKNGFRKFLPDFTGDLELALNILQELDEFTFTQQAVGFKTFIDIQQEKLNDLNLSLQKSEVQLLEAQELANMGSFDWDLGGNNSYFTPQFYRIFEIEKPVKFAQFLRFVHWEDRQKLTDAVNSSLTQDSDGIYECEYRYQKDGPEKLIWSRGIVSFREGRPYKMRGTIMDVTERHKTVLQLAELNYSLEQKNMELERSNKELTSFGYVASHDLQEPLRNIKIFINMVVERESANLSEKGKQLLTRVNSATGRMQRLIEDLLTFSRMQAFADEFVSVDLNAVIGEIKSLHSEAINENKIIISSAKLPVMQGIAFQLQQLFDNLITNSIKYSRQGTVLRINISSELISGQSILAEGGEAGRQYFRISVADNGIGFEQIYAHKIFEIFQRLHGKDEYSGTGIGLAICKKIVQNHNGVIYASGVPDEGATIYICLPVL